MKEPRVKDIIEHYRIGNIKAVYEYLTQTDMIVNPETWCGNIKKLIENKQFITTQETIELLAYKFLKNI